MSRFQKILNEYKYLTEQDDMSTQPPPTDTNAQVSAPPVAVPPTPESPEEPEALAPESEVLLVRLLKQALVMDIKPDDVNLLSDMEDINEKNAKESLTKLINVMKSYSADIDIDTNPSTTA